MKIEGVSAASLLGNTGIQRTLKKSEETSSLTSALAASNASLVGASVVSLATQSASNMMSRNFVQATYERSRFVDATIASRQTEQSYSNKMNSLLSSMQSQFTQIASSIQVSSSDSTYVAAIISGEKIERTVEQVKDQEVSEKSEEDLKDTREALDQKAQEALAPKDADGNPLQTAVGTDSQTTSASTDAQPASAGQESQSETTPEVSTQTSATSEAPQQTSPADEDAADIDAVTSVTALADAAADTSDVEAGLPAAASAVTAAATADVAAGTSSPATVSNVSVDIMV
ncbi:MAG: hypothetical protein AB9872_02720 [Solidesulfovibrio sp.]